MRVLTLLYFLFGMVSCKSENKQASPSANNIPVEINQDLLADLFIIEAHAELNDPDDLERSLENYYKLLAAKHNISVQEIKNELQKVEKNPEAFSRVISRLMDIRNEGYKND